VRVRVRVRVGPIAAAAGVCPVVLADCRWQAAAGRLGLPLSAGRAPRRRRAQIEVIFARAAILPRTANRHVIFCGHTRLL
jgi:hypothetical protein